MHHILGACGGERTQSTRTWGCLEIWEEKKIKATDLPVVCAGKRVNSREKRFIELSSYMFLMARRGHVHVQRRLPRPETPRGIKANRGCQVGGWGPKHVLPRPTCPYGFCDVHPNAPTKRPFRPPTTWRPRNGSRLGQATPATQTHCAPAFFSESL